jgi:hypothetical protein
MNNKINDLQLTPYTTQKIYNYSSDIKTPYFIMPYNQNLLHDKKPKLVETKLKQFHIKKIKIKEQNMIEQNKISQNYLTYLSNNIYYLINILIRHNY